MSAKQNPTIKIKKIFILSFISLRRCCAVVSTPVLGRSVQGRSAGRTPGYCPCHSRLSQKLLPRLSS